MNALKVLENDHYRIGELFSSYDASTTVSQKEEAAHSLIVELSVHASLEESILFRFAREAGVTLQQLVQRGADLHEIIASTLSSLEGVLAKPSEAEGRDAQLDALVKTLANEARRHIQEDVNWLFPALRRAMSTTQLESIGVLMIYGRPTARRHPPRSAAQAPGVIALGDGSAS